MSTVVQCERPASYELLTHDHPATDRAMTQDYNGLPAPWQWLKDAKPEPGQHCEWVALGPCWSGTGQGEWTEIDTSVNPDNHFWGCGRVIVKGFRDEKGIAVYDPTITAWRLIPAPTTRSADVASIGSSAFTSFYNQSEGTMFV